MRTVVCTIMALSLAALSSVPAQTRPVSTYSIVARDSATGEIGVAVQSHWFAVGQLVPWAEAGVGGVATQSFVDPAYGTLGIDLLRAGKGAPDALRALLHGERMLAALEAAEAAGGDIRGRQSAALIVSASTGRGRTVSSTCGLTTTPHPWPNYVGW